MMDGTDYAKHLSALLTLKRVLHQYNGVMKPKLNTARSRNRIWHSEDSALWYILIIKPTRCTNFSNLFLE